MKRTFTIGTRGSELSLTQTNHFKDALEALDPSIELKIEIIKTSGDKKQGTAAAGKGDKKDWIFELEKSLLDGSIDLAVHSGKDCPARS